MAGGARLTLNDGRMIPQVGLGVWRTPADDAAVVVRSAVQAGYRAADTAAISGTQTGAGGGARVSAHPRAVRCATSTATTP